MAEDGKPADNKAPWITDFLDRAYFEGWALALIFGTVEEARAGRYGYAIACGLMSALCQFVVVRWEWLKLHANPRFVSTTHKIATDARWWVGTLMVFLAFLALSPLVEQRRWPFVDWLNRGNENIEVQKTTLIDWLQRAQQERDAARNALADAQLSAANNAHSAVTPQSMPQRFGFQTGFNLMNELRHSDAGKILPRTFVLLTANPSNDQLRRDFEMILSDVRVIIPNPQSSLVLIGPPNKQKDLDAPALEETKAAGITVHGRNPAADFLMSALSDVGFGCLITHRTQDAPSALVEFYHKTLPNTEDIKNIAWIQIGDGPVERTPGCLTE